MAKTSIRDMRRSELSQAAFETLIEFGTRNTTLERVAARAGVSKGVVLHHFKDKDALFEGVMRRASSLLRDSVVELLRHAENPFERLAAIFVGNFADLVFKQEVCHAWICLCADVPYNPQLQRIYATIHARMKSNLLVALKHIEPNDAEVLAKQFRFSIDGIWLQASTREKPMTSREGIDHIVAAAHLQLGLSEIDETRFSKALEKMEAIANIILKSKAYSEKTIRST